MAKRKGLNFNDESITDLFNFNDTSQHRQTPKEESIKVSIAAEDNKENKPTETKNYEKHETKTTNKGLKAENQRTTLVIAKRHLQILDALSSYTNIKKIDILTQLLDKGLAELNKTQPTLTDEALKQYQSITKSLF